MLSHWRMKRCNSRYAGNFELKYLLKYLIMKNVEKKLFKGNQTDLYFFSYRATKQHRNSQIKVNDI